MKKILLLVTILGLLVGCVTEVPKVTAISHPLLPYDKIQLPKEGCLTGIFAAKLFKVKEPSLVEQIVNYYSEAFGSKPSTFILMVRLEAGFPTTESTTLIKDNIIPFIHCDIGPKSPGMGPPSLEVKDIAAGKYDNYILEYAKGAAEFGKKYGGFFFTTMEEMNANWYDWGQNSSFIKAWKHMWQIFEDQGANQYATWVWAISSKAGQLVDDPEPYYPGDKYVDWVSFNGFSVRGASFYSLTFRTYKQILKKHPQKPIMVESFAVTNNYSQPRWLKHAYSSIKNDFPLVKGAIYWDNTWTLTGDHRLNSNGLKALKEIFKDPYWLMAK